MSKFKCESKFGEFRAGYVYEMVDGKEVFKGFVVLDAGGEVIKTGFKLLADAVKWAKTKYEAEALRRSLELATQLESASQALESKPEPAREEPVIRGPGRRGP